MKKAKENWIGEQCSETEENLTKNNSKRAYQLVKDLTTVKQKTLADRRIANPMDPVLSHYTSQERQPAAVPGLPNDQPHQSPKQSHAEDQTEQIEASSGEDHCRRTGRLQSRKEDHRADLQPMTPL